LSSSEKRARYDQFGHAGLGNGFGSGGSGFSNVEDIFENFGSIFEDIFGMGGGGRKKSGGGNRARKGSDLRYDMKISFKEAVLGTEKKIQLTKKVTCTGCEGSGAAKGTKPVTCSTCRGQGQVAVQQGFFTYASACPDCGGSGKKISTPCSDCRGSGMQTKANTLTVKVPAGIDAGMRLRVSGEGEAGSHPGHAGDLYVFIEVMQEKNYRREDFDLIYSLQIGVAQAILGTEVSIDTFEEKPCKVEIPAGIQPGQRLVVQGSGIARLEKYGRGKGDLIVEVHVQIPTKVSKEAEEHLRAFAEKVGQNVKDSGGFFDKIFG